MKFANENLELEEAINKEWLITNGIGGYASSTILGINTRRYHGLLVAPLIPPSKRTLILSKLDESLEIDGRRYELFSNIGKNYISQGYKYQTSFVKEYMPIFAYKVEDIEITKVVCMQYSKNTVGIYYKIKNGDKRVKLNLAPIMNYRDIHGENKNHLFNIEQALTNNKIKLKIDGGCPIYIKISDGKYVEHYNDTFHNMFYIEEEKRGFDAEENHAVPGRFEIEIQPKEEKEISFICSLEENIDELNVKTIITNEIIRLNKQFINSLLIDNRKDNKTEKEIKRDELIKQLLITCDNFVIKRPFFGSYSIIAGYHWFLDWMRDTLIAFEGLLLIPKKYDIAKQVLKTCVRDMKYGLVPNSYGEQDNDPLYNSVDSSLLLFEQVKRYLEYTDDTKFVMEEMYSKLEEIINNYQKGIDLEENNIYMDVDGLIVAGTEYTQNTWMDAKYGEVAATPRNGKAVEINALWYNALKIMEELAIKKGEKEKARKYEKISLKCKSSFEKEFYNKKRKCLYDVVGDGKIRPNQLFALSLTYPVIDPSSEIAKEMFDTVTKKLLNNYGLKTLAKGEDNYVDVYEGDAFRRDFSYHQGITWPWLLGLYYNSLKKLAINSKNKAEREEYKKMLKEFIKDVTETFSKEMNERGCIGSISEIYDSKRPYLPKGAIAQAWSVAEIFRIIMER